MPSQSNNTVIILAGGQSKRMGYDKEFLKIDGEYLIYRQIELLRQMFDEIIVVSKNDEFYQGKDVKVVHDILPYQTPLTGLHAGLVNSSSEYSFLIACDMPSINLDYIKMVQEMISSDLAYVSEVNGYFEPFQAVYSKKLVKLIEKFILSSQKFQSFIQSIDSKTVINPERYFEFKIFQNLNTVEDVSMYNQADHAYEEFEIIKHFEDTSLSQNDFVINEFPITLFINHQKFITFLMTPKYIEELIIGYLKSEKIIDHLSDITSLKIDLEQYRVEVILQNEIELSTTNKDKILSSGCGVGTKYHEDIDHILIDAIFSDYRISYQDIIRSSRELNKKSGLFNLTGGVHSCLFYYGEQSFYVEDIGRHNAVDKVVGFILKNKINTKETYIISSGRISSDMLLKCAVIGIPIVLSRSAPTSLAIKLAEKLGITLIGFVRGSKYNVYTNSQRIVR
ncbi:MAG: formate dehydrogenase accessory sulfurtransferase FdhD [Firmicutes bacterium]|nr:formate dehydrogenase accessory sulfurtransferase FdhD [Bacillota bacterium]